MRAREIENFEWDRGQQLFMITVLKVGDGQTSESVTRQRLVTCCNVTRFTAVCIACRSVVQRVRPLRISHPSETARRAHISRNRFVTRSANDKNQLIYVQKLFRITAYNSYAIR